jgi:hypothetical protein
VNFAVTYLLLLGLCLIRWEPEDRHKSRSARGATRGGVFGTAVGGCGAIPGTVRLVFVINTDGWHTSIPTGPLSVGEDLVTDSPRLSYALPDVYDSLKLDCR